MITSSLKRTSAGARIQLLLTWRSDFKSAKLRELQIRLFSSAGSFSIAMADSETASDFIPADISSMVVASPKVAGDLLTQVVSDIGVELLILMSHGN